MLFLGNSTIDQTMPRTDGILAFLLTPLSPPTAADIHARTTNLTHASTNTLSRACTQGTCQDPRSNQLLYVSFVHKSFLFYCEHKSQRIKLEGHPVHAFALQWSTLPPRTSKQMLYLLSDTAHEGGSCPPEVNHFLSQIPLQ